MPLENSSVIFVSPPDGYPEPGKHLIYEDYGSIDLENVSLGGGLLVKALALSIDPYQRGRMAGTYERSFEAGKPMLGYGVGVVIRSESPDFKPGEHIYTEHFPFQQYAVIPTADILRKIVNRGFPWRQYVGVLGMPGQTAYVAYKAFAQAKAGETIYVSTGAGAVGSIVCQLAKIDGLRVIASAGSDAKVAYLSDIGVDVAFNYKKEHDLESFMKKHGPVDIYWDNVGGESLDIMIRVLQEYGRIIKCGNITQNNKTGSPYGIKNIGIITGKTITISGFMILRLIAHVGDFDFNATVSNLLKDGKLKIKEDVRYGLKEAPQLLLDVQKGDNTGKAVILVADN